MQFLSAQVPALQRQTSSWRNLHPSEQLRITWVSAQAIEKRVDLQENQAVFSTLVGFFKVFESFLSIPNPHTDKGQIVKTHRILFSTNQFLLSLKRILPVASPT